MRRDRAVVLAQVGGELATVLAARVAAGAERAAAVPGQPVARRRVEVLTEAQLAQLALERPLRLSVRNGWAELAAEYHADRHANPSFFHCCRGRAGARRKLVLPRT